MLKDSSARLQVGPSFFDAPGAELAQLPGRGTQDLEDFAVTVVFCNCCYYKVKLPKPLCPQYIGPSQAQSLFPPAFCRNARIQTKPLMKMQRFPLHEENEWHGSIARSAC